MADILTKNIDENLWLPLWLYQKTIFLQDLKQIDSWLKLSDIRNQKIKLKFAICSQADVNTD